MDSIFSEKNLYHLDHQMEFLAIKDDPRIKHILYKYLLDEDEYLSLLNMFITHLNKKLKVDISDYTTYFSHF